MERYRDILLNENKDISFKNGDFAFGESIDQEVDLIMRSNKGEWRHDPLLGVNMIKNINAKRGLTNIEQQLKIQLKRDNKHLNSISIDNNIIKADVTQK